MRFIWLLLMPLMASAQLSTTPGGGVMWYKSPVAGAPAGYYYPTNIPGTTPRGWWVFDDYRTNGANAELTNRMATPVVTLIQATAADRPYLLDNGLGTHKVGQFTGGVIKLSSTAGFTNSQPVSVWIIYTATNTSAYGVIGAHNTGSGFYAGHNTPTVPKIFAGTAVNANTVVSNQWYCYTYVFNTTSSSIWTNMSANITGQNAGSSTWTNMTIGGPSGSAATINGQVAEWAVFDGPIDSTVISNLFRYATNTYGNVF